MLFTFALCIWLLSLLLKKANKIAGPKSVTKSIENGCPSTCQVAKHTSWKLDTCLFFHFAPKRHYTTLTPNLILLDFFSSFSLPFPFPFPLSLTSEPYVDSWRRNEWRRGKVPRCSHSAAHLFQWPESHLQQHSHFHCPAAKWASRWVATTAILIFFVCLIFFFVLLIIPSILLFLLSPVIFKLLYFYLVCTSGELHIFQCVSHEAVNVVDDIYRVSIHLLRTYNITVFLSNPH